MLLGGCERPAVSLLDRELTRAPATMLETQNEPIIEVGPIPPGRVARLYRELPKRWQGVERAPRTSCECLQVELLPGTTPPLLAIRILNDHDGADPMPLALRIDFDPDNVWIVQTTLLSSDDMVQPDPQVPANGVTR